MLEDVSAYQLVARGRANGKSYAVPAEQIVFPDGAGGNLLDIVLSEDMLPGEYEMVFNW
jgi:hypothetical protein